MARNFLLVDINSYFATLLQQENPILRGKPVVIVKDLGRTCVIAASKEAKELGIKTGSNVIAARHLASNLIELKAEFDLYLSATRKLEKLFKSFAPHVYLYSLDEAFLEVTDCRLHLYPDLQQLGKIIQDKIKQELGEWVTANVGIGSNRLLAKMAAEIGSKACVFEINQDNLDPVLASVEFKDVCGIGTRLAEKLFRMGVTHPYQIRFYSQTDLEPLFGPFWSRELLKIAYGEEPHHLQLLDDDAYLFQSMKSVSRSITAWKLVDSYQQIRQILFNLAREVIYKMRRMGLAGRRVAVALIGSNEMWHCQQTYKSFISHTPEMFVLIESWLQQKWHQQFKPIKFVVSIGLLQNSNQLTSPLLPCWQKQEKIETAIDQLDERYGLYTVRSAVLQQQTELIKPEVTGFFGDRKYQQQYL